MNPVATAVEIHQDISDFPLFPPLSDVIRSPFANLDLQQAVVALPYLLFAGLSLFVILTAAIGAPIAAARNGVTKPAVTAYDHTVECVWWNFYDVCSDPSGTPLRRMHCSHTHTADNDAPAGKSHSNRIRR